MLDRLILFRFPCRHGLPRGVHIRCYLGCRAYSGTPDSASVFHMEAANAARFGLAVFTYDLNAVDVHRPVNWMSLSGHPAFAIMVAKPALKL